MVLTAMVLATPAGAEPRPRVEIDVSKPGWKWRMRDEAKGVYRAMMTLQPECRRPLLLVFPSREDHLRWVVEGVCGDAWDTETPPEPRR